MTTDKIKSASQALTDFLAEQAEDDALDAATVLAIQNLLGQGKLTKINLLRQLEEARDAAKADNRPTP